MNKTLFLLLSAFAISAQANITTEKVSLSTSTMTIEKQNTRNGTFSRLNMPGIELNKHVGTPELPVRSLLLQGRPGDIKVQMKTTKLETFAGLKPMPVQSQPCRCDVPEKPFRFNAQSYETSSAYTLKYLGAFRGTPITRLDINLAYYDAKANSTVFRTETEFAYDAPVYSFESREYSDYLIIAPASLVEGVNKFADWKRSRGNTVHIETLAAPNNTLAGISAMVKSYYTDKGVDFVIFVGDESTIPMFQVDTSGSSRTPTDLKHFTMDGADDHVPDMFYSRIVATSAIQAEFILSKAIEFEQKSFENMSGLKSMIGIASNEGYNPSDDEYVTSIENKFKSALGIEATHYKQNNSNSKPSELNKSFDNGAVWLTYLGHGSGTSWPSMYQTYTTSHVRGMSNNTSVKPVIIDVACMNGKITSSYLGSSFMKTDSRSPFGAVAYLGGTVNISWHPPAVMARGIAYEHIDKKFKHLGEAILAGQLYLAANWNDEEDVIDNFEWYHLQGDPGMNIEFQ
ncbi:MAG: C25 family cysteine peptidase [Pseudobdellovibrionaceae bacterium]